MGYRPPRPPAWAPTGFSQGILRLINEPSRLLQAGAGDRFGPKGWGDWIDRHRACVQRLEQAGIVWGWIFAAVSVPFLAYLLATLLWGWK